MSKELLIAVYEGDIKKTDSLLKAGADINFVPDEKLQKELFSKYHVVFDSPLYLTVKMGNLGMLQFLSQYPDQKLDLNALSSNGYCNVLFYILQDKVILNFKDFVGFFLSANVSFYTGQLTPVHLLKTYDQNDEVVKMFLFEALFRADPGTFKDILGDRKIKIDKNELTNYLRKYPRLQPSAEDLQHLHIAKGLRELVASEKITNDWIELSAIFGDPTLYSNAQNKNPLNTEKALLKQIEELKAENARLKSQLNGLLKQSGPERTNSTMYLGK